MRIALLLALLLSVPLPARPDAPPLTEVERLKIENVRLEGVILQRQFDDWQAKKAKLKADIEAARPGWTWNPDDGIFTPVKPAK